MPFTLAHPAAILFLKNKYFNFLALILGAMSPDFIYFLLFKPISNLGHTLFGFLFLNLQLCFLINFLLHNFIKEGFIMSIPNKISKKYMFLIETSSNLNSFKNIFIFIYSSLLGMITHIIWDSFTHKTGYFVQKIDILSYKFNILNHHIPVYKLLQHTSSIIGIIVIIIFLYKFKKDTVQCHSVINKKFKIIYYSIVITFIILISVISFIYSFYIYGNIAIGTVVVSPINGLFLGLLFGGIYYNFQKKGAVSK